MKHHYNADVAAGFTAGLWGLSVMVAKHNHWRNSFRLGLVCGTALCSPSTLIPAFVLAAAGPAFLYGVNPAASQVLIGDNGEDGHAADAWRMSDANSQSLADIRGRLATQIWR